MVESKHMARRSLNDDHFTQELVASGLTETEALRVTLTEIEGAHESVNGLEATQTFCDVLEESEDLPDSVGAREGAMASRQALQDWLSRNSDSPFAREALRSLRER